MAMDLLFRVWDPVNGYDAKAAIEHKPENDANDSRYWYLFPNTEDGTGCIELGSPCRDEDDSKVIFEGDLIRAFFGWDSVIHNGLVCRHKNTGEWIVYDDVIHYDEHGNVCVRNLETCNHALLSCLTHVQITGNIHDYEKEK